jgi:hypothetical protein
VISGEGLTVARVWLKDGYVVPQHSHLHEQVSQVVSGKLHEVLCIGDVYETDTWTPRRDDWLDGSDSYIRG